MRLGDVVPPPEIARRIFIQFASVCQWQIDQRIFWRPQGRGGQEYRGGSSRDSRHKRTIGGWSPKGVRTRFAADENDFTPCGWLGWFKPGYGAIATRKPVRQF